jgi:hypothetical protein
MVSVPPYRANSGGTPFAFSQAYNPLWLDAHLLVETDIDIGTALFFPYVKKTIAWQNRVPSPSSFSPQDSPWEEKWMKIRFDFSSQIFYNPSYTLT